VIPSLATLTDATITALDCIPRPTSEAKDLRRLARIALLFVELGATEAGSALKSLRFSNAEARRIADLAATWSAVGNDIKASLTAPTPTPDVDVRRWVAKIGRLDLAPFMRIAAALTHASGAGRARSGSSLGSLYHRMLRIAWRDPIAIADLAIDGDDLRMVGILPGPWVGKILQALLDAVLGEPSRNRRDWLLQEAQRLFESMGRG
jgi:tRNA nucleotidyltransferase (CCA-adding enzyme)